MLDEINHENYQISEEIEKVRSLEGLERSAALLFIEKYIKKKYGENGFKNLLNELKKYNFIYPDTSQYKGREWIPKSTVLVVFVASVLFFKWTKEEVFEAGRNVIVMSPIIKRFQKFFIAFRVNIIKTANSWQRFHKPGKLEVLEVDDKAKKVVIRIHNFETHPFACIFLAGNYSKIAEFIIGKKIKITEDKCMYEDNSIDYHQYVFTWE